MAKAKKTDNVETKEVVEAKVEKVKKSPKKSEEVELTPEDKKAKLAKLMEKAKKLESSVEEEKKVDLKKKVKEEETEKENTLVPMDDYLKASIHLGTRVITPDMRRYVYRRRADGLAVFNTALLDDKIREGISYLNKFNPSRILLVCKREAGWKAANKFSELTGIKVFTKKYPAGILTNTNLDNFMETDLVFICDPWLDKNALMDAMRVRVPVLSICDTNNFTQGITQSIPGNNKSAKSIGMILFLLARAFMEHHKIEGDIKIQDFIDDWDNLIPPK
ncbi:MAG: 30S ribosomal protein S2 [Nanoarchaeota archaeon]